MIKYNDNNISKWFDGGSSIKKVYHNNHVCFQSAISGSTPPPTPTAMKFSATYSGGATYSAECDGNTTLTSGNTRPAGYTYSAMTSAVIGDCVTSIGQQAFYYCSNLTNIDIPSGVTVIGGDAFYACSALTSIVIPSGVTTIGGGAFQGCHSFTSVTIPNSVTHIGGSAFYGCIGLTEIIINATVPPTGVELYTFDYTNNCPIYVPAESVDAYKSAWSFYASRIVADVDYIDLPSSAPYAGLESLTMPNANQYYELDFMVKNTSGKDLYIIGQPSQAETVSYQMKFSCYRFPYYDFGGGRLQTNYSSMGAVGSRCHVGIGVYTGDSAVEIRNLYNDTRLANNNSTPSYAAIPLLFGGEYITNTKGNTEASERRSSGIRYYGVKVYESGTLVANYVPAINPTTNKYTLYDTISEEYCEQIGTGEITGRVK